jgi:hypothetical protein
VGNLVHPVDTADGAALDGRHVAAAVRAHLDGTTTTAGQVELTAAAPLRWVTPQLVAPGATTPRGDLLLWTDRHRSLPVVRATQAGRVLARRRLPWPAAPGRVFRIPSSLVATAVVGAGRVVIDLE